MAESPTPGNSELPNKDFYSISVAIIAIICGQYYFDIQQKQRLEDFERTSKATATAEIEKVIAIQREDLRDAQQLQIHEVQKSIEENINRLASGPKIEYLSGRAEADDTFVYNFVNKSAAFDAVITQVELVITDQEELAAISRIHPRPASGNGGCPLYGQDGFFFSGCWVDNNYQFNSAIEQIVPKGGNGQIRLRVANKKYGNRWIKGELRLYYNGIDSPYRLPNSSVKSSPAFDRSR